MARPPALVDHPQLWKTFLVFLLPLIATNILQNTSGTINTIFVGQMLGVECHCCSVGIFSHYFLPDGLCDWAFGRIDRVGRASVGRTKCRKSTLSSDLMTLIGGSIIACLGVIFAKQILLLLGTDPESDASFSTLCNGCWQAAHCCCVYYLYLYFTWSGR